MIHFITDTNIDSVDFNQLEPRMLCFNHREYTHFHYRSCASIKYVNKGCVKYLIEGQSITLTAGKYLFVGPETEVTTTIKEPSEGYTIFFSPDSVSSAGQTMDAFPIFDREVIKQLEELRKRFMANQNKQYLDQIESLTFQYLKNVFEQSNSLSQKSFDTRLSTLNKVFQVREKMENSSNEHLSIDDLAETALLSKFELIRRFKEVFGVSPYKFYQTIKIEQTKSDLIEGKTLSQIADRYKLGDAFSFSKLFKKITGYTPTQFRNSCI